MRRSRFRRQVDAASQPTSQVDYSAPTACMEMFNALSVVVRDPKTRAYLADNDPQALLQAELALSRYVGGWSSKVAGRTKEQRTVEAGLADARSRIGA